MTGFAQSIFTDNNTYEFQIHFIPRNTAIFIEIPVKEKYNIGYVTSDRLTPKVLKEDE